MGKKIGRTKKYSTHPLVKAALTMSLLLTAAVCLAAYGFCRYVSSEEARVTEERLRCAYEAYVSLCENLARGETAAAADALARCELFTDCGEAASLRLAILSEAADARIAEALAIDGDAEPSDIADAVRRADRAAEALVDDVPRVLGAAEGEPDAWATLKGRLQITEDEARDIAERCVGGGVTLTAAKNHGTPLVYSFYCRNASADVTRMGGRLLRFYAFRHGGAVRRGDGECRDEAVRFLRAAGISDGVILDETPSDDEAEFVFCGTLLYDGERIEAVDETVTVRVARAGAVVYFFDASEYYRVKPVSYGEPSVKIGRAKASEMLGADGKYLSLVYTDGGLFWRLCGVKTLLLNAETGEIRVQNP